MYEIGIGRILLFEMKHDEVNKLKFKIIFWLAFISSESDTNDQVGKT